MRIGEFANNIIGKPLYPYQETIGDAILDSVLQRRGLTFTVMLARQMGKNQLSAMLEAYLLYNQESGTIVKAAPTFRPQVVNSYQRLLFLLENEHTAARIWRSHSYIVGLASGKARRGSRSGPSAMFFSAGSEASIVGATASLLLEIDEAQDVSVDKFDRDLRPMASTTNATTILYGTAWSDDTLLAAVRAHNLELERRDGLKRHFEYDWRTLAALNPHYRRFVEGEIERLGEDHITIRTQYRLLPISGAGHLFDAMQRHLLQGQHPWENDPLEEGVYVAGMDVGGEEREQSASPLRDARTSHESTTSQPRGSGHDSTVITIGRVSYNELHLPVIKIVHQYWWTGRHYLEQYAQAVAICEHWRVRRLVIDTTGLGDIMASLLRARLGEERISPFRFSRPTKSRLAYHLLSMVSSGRCKLYSREAAPDAIYQECWKQLNLARRRLPGQGLLDMYVEQAEGHDDFLISLALCCEAVRDWLVPDIEAYIIPPPHFYTGESRY